MSDRPVYAYQLPPGPRLLEALTAALDGDGPAVLPLSPALPDRALQETLRALHPHALVTPDRAVPLNDGIAVPGETAVIMTTSGSTGRPKGVRLPGTALRHSAAAGLARLGARPGRRWLACLPADHIAGLQVLVRAIVSGTDPVFTPSGGGFDVAAATATQAAYVSLVPTMLARLLDSGADLSVFEGILLGGAAVTPGLLDRARSAGGRLVTTYGMTETSGGCVYDGRALDGVRIGLDRPDEDGTGRIRIAGPTVMSDYHLRADADTTTFDGDWLHTGDLGCFDDGLLHVLGRVDDVIITGGHNVMPVEVERVLLEHPDIADVAVVGRPDREWGDRVVAVVVPADPARPPTLSQVRRFVRHRAPVPSAPRELDVVSRIPLLQSGKPDRATLRRGAFFS